MACGDIEQSLDTVDITDGVILDSVVSCGSNLNCQDASATINITELTVDSFTVTANDIDITDDESTSLSDRPDEITLEVVANFSNDESLDITDDGNLIYIIIDIDGQDEIIQEVSDSAGEYTVLAAGTAKIQLHYRDEDFVVILEVP